MDSVRFYVLTWNVACKSPEDSLDVPSLLGWDDPAGDLPDVYVIGLQEVKAQVQNMVLDTIFDDPWTRVFRERLVEKGFVKIRTVRLQGLVLNVFIRRSRLLSVRDLAWELVRTGFGGLWGNKGGVAIRMNYNGVSVCLVNTHLHPHDENLQDRVNGYNTIVDQIKFPKHQPTEMVFFHDYVIWLGDNNFRIDESISREEILSRIKMNDLEWLLERDQLNQVRHDGHAFSELVEPPLNFPPTYKFHFNSTVYDEKRRPAWTDRILYRVTENAYENLKLSVSVEKYMSLQHQLQSDHRPVMAKLTIKTFADHEERIVQFSSLGEWSIDKENVVSFVLGDDVKVNDFDWIGIYKANFSALDEYVSFMYVNPRPSSDESPRVNRRQGQQIKISFPDHSIKSRGRYCLLYITDSWGSVLGVSETFDAVRTFAGGSSAPGTPIRGHKQSSGIDYGSYPPIDSTPLRTRRPSPSRLRNRPSSSDSSDSLF